MGAKASERPSRVPWHRGREQSAMTSAISHASVEQGEFQQGIPLTRVLQRPEAGNRWLDQDPTTRMPPIRAEGRRPCSPIGRPWCPVHSNARLEARSEQPRRDLSRFAMGDRAQTLSAGPAGHHRSANARAAEDRSCRTDLPKPETLREARKSSPGAGARAGAQGPEKTTFAPISLSVVKMRQPAGQGARRQAIRLPKGFPDRRISVLYTLGDAHREMGICDRLRGAGKGPVSPKTGGPLFEDEISLSQGQGRASRGGLRRPGPSHRRSTTSSRSRQRIRPADAHPLSGHRRFPTGLRPCHDAASGAMERGGSPRPSGNEGARRACSTYQRSGPTQRRSRPGWSKASTAADQVNAVNATASISSRGKSPTAEAGGRAGKQRRSRRVRQVRRSEGEQPGYAALTQPQPRASRIQSRSRRQGTDLEYFRRKRRLLWV